MKPIACKYLFLLTLAIMAPLSAYAKPWKGAEVITRDTFKYGAYEARIRAAEGSGLITAFFLWKDGSELEGTEWQEQDIEIFGKDGRYQTQLMTPGEPRTPHSINHVLATNAFENYYTFRMEWTPNYLAFYVDGSLVRWETNKTEYAKLLDPNRAEAAQLRISIWAGDWSWPGAFDASKAPAYTYVDFIQTFDYTPGRGPDQSDFSLRWRDDFNSLNTNRWWFANWTFDRAISDYTTSNARTINGKLVLGLTNEAQAGRFPNTVPADNPPLPPIDFEIYSSLDEDVIPFAAPARIEAEDFQGYRDTDAGNNGGSVCGTSGDVDTQLTSDPEGHCNVGWIRPGEYLDYFVRIPTSEEYTFTLRASAADPGRRFHVEVDGENVSGTLAPQALGNQVYQDLTFTTPLVDGIRKISIVFDTGYMNLNYFVIDNTANPTNPDPSPRPDPQPEPEPEPEIPDNTGPTPLPGRVEAEAYSDYLDFTAGNIGAPTCGQTDVDLQPTNDIDGGCNIGWTDPGEYTEYFLNSPADAVYTVSLRLASGQANRFVRLEVDGSVIATDLYAPSTGWQAYEDVSVEVPLEAGEHRVKVLFETGRVNFNYMTWTVIGNTTPVEPEVPVDPEVPVEEPEIPVEEPEVPVEEPEVPVEEPEVPVSCTPTVYEAETMFHSTGGSYDGGWNIWSNGYISTAHNFGDDDFILTVKARGDFGGSQRPNMRVSIGGEVIGEVEIISTDYLPYEFFLNMTAGSAEVKIEFTNDYYANGQDRNLRVDALELDDCL